MKKESKDSVFPNACACKKKFPFSAISSCENKIFKESKNQKQVDDSNSLHSIYYSFHDIGNEAAVKQSNIWKTAHINKLPIT